ncbi:hypothetical protein BCV69DRAFT_167523 [Microstroma glucosiphilum]|uniref:F-box domain-containing protein n=1 Tax=Pseudomicrostroma glucosiphilum TaxID=1684307 RepID=A0A316U923_9BASI|nr:hypothetical protein BCV69DRAFT_167523 [Pseudomicrostroma glucosiphilum]PWN21344.1 hypothetical protein BCV69DRAFT_167523 [Pseudomicrostroma glucosiphilum]
MSPVSTSHTAMSPSSSSSSVALPSTHRDLRALPLEILDKIGYFTALAANPPSSSSSSSSSATTSYAAPPPQALRDLLLTCRHVNDHLSVSANPRLYARIFKAKFDLEPIARRYGRKATTVENLAGELRRRCVILKRIRWAVAVGQLRPEGETALSEIELKENMWLAYLMMTENDGKNLEALYWADIRSYLSLHHTQEMIRSALQPGYPPESEDRALAMHISHLLSDANLLATESKEDADEKLFVLRPYVFASHRFNGFYAPWPLRSLPIGTESPLTIAESTASASGQTLLERNRGAPVPMPAAAEGQSSTAPRATPGAPTNPFLADHTPEDRSTLVHHVGQTLTIRPPCIVHAAYHLFFGQVERNPGLVGLTAITRRHPPPGSGATGATDNNADDPALQPSTLAGPLRQLHADPMRLRSADHDRDVARLLYCHSPMRGPGLKPCFFAGIIDGAWEGRFSFFCFDSYREMLAGRMRSLYEGPFGEQPQVWKLREHFLRVDESAAFLPMSPLRTLWHFPVV